MEFLAYLGRCFGVAFTSLLQLVLAPLLYLIDNSRNGPRKSFKSVLITGASSGLGAALAVAFAKPGVNVAITGRNVDRLRQVEKDCVARGATVTLGVLDVVDTKTMQDFVSKVDDEHPIDLVIANAGITGFSESKDESYTALQSFVDVTNSNVIGVGNTILPIIPRMCARRKGQVAIMSSMSGWFPFQAAPDYGASKAFVTTYGRSLRKYLASFSVGMSVITPGFVRTALLNNGEKYPMEIGIDEATPIMVDGLERNAGIIAFPNIMYYLATIVGNLDPISLWVLGPYLGTRLSRKVTTVVTGVQVETKKKANKTH